MSETPPGIDSIVRSRFRVRDSFQLPEGELEYRVEYGQGSKESFRALWSELLPRGLTPWLQGPEDDCSLVIRKRQQPGPPVSRIPVLMALLTTASVVAFGILETLIYASFAPSIPKYIVLISYCACILAILVAHEFGHRFVSERRGTAPPTPYLIPGVPDFTAFLPSLGIISLQREPSVNKDSLFEVSIAGPLAAFIVSLALYVLGSFASVQSAVPVAGNQVVDALISVNQINPGVLQMAIDSVLSPFVQPAAQGYFRLSPVNDAAAIGFLLTFLSFLPMSFFDGGYLAGTLLGGRGVKVATYLSVLLLVALDTPTYWAPAIVVLLIASRQPKTQLLDEVSQVARSRRLVFLLTVLLAFLCLPIPQNIATFPLG